MLIFLTEFEQGDKLYTIRKTIKCKDDNTTENLDVTCTFENGLGQPTQKMLNIPVITCKSGT